MGRVSGWGWAFGYLGGLVSLGICLVYITWAQKQGQRGNEFVPVVMLITAAVFALAATPTFLFLKERALPAPRARAAVEARAADPAPARATTATCAASSSASCSTRRASWR